MKNSIENTADKYPKISVDMGCYNFAKYIAEAIESVLAQTLQPYEIIISDDCSDDNSWEIIQKYQKQYPDFIRAFQTSKNIGMKQCGILRKDQVKGELLSSIDGDDRWLPQKLEFEWEALKKYPEAKLAYSNVFIINELGEKIGVWYDGNGECPPSGDVFIKTFAKRFFKTNRNVFRNQLMYYDVLKEIGYKDLDDNLIHTDWDKKIRLTAKYKVAYSGHALVEYRNHDKGIHRTKANDLFKSANYVVRKNMHLLKTRPKNEIVYVKRNIRTLLDKLADLSQIEYETIEFPNFSAVLESPGPVLINSLPKSGTNMAAKVLQLLSGFSQEAFHLGFSNIDQFNHYYNDQNDSVKIGVDFPTEANIDLIKNALQSLEPQTFATAHLPFSPSLAQLLQSLRFKMLLILRDPRDVVVSHAKYVRSSPAHPLFTYYQTLNSDEQIMASIKGVEGNLRMPDINQRVRSVLQWSEQPFTYTTYFEKLVGRKGGGRQKDQKDEIRNISDHLGFHLAESEIDKITNNVFGGTVTFRKGKIGAWRESFNENHIKAFNTIAGDLLNVLGYQTKDKSIEVSRAKEQIKVKKMEEEYLGNNLIFIISQPRAGSTLLQRILSGHAQIHSIAEPWIMLHPVYALKKNGCNAEYDSSLARNALDDFLNQIPEGQDLYYLALRRFSATLYNRMTELTSKTFFLDKTPRYYYIIEELYRIFPEAKFIVLLRNPMAVLSSVLKTWFNNNPQELISSSNWADIIKGPGLIVQGIRALKSSAICVKYEELVSNPDKVVHRLCGKINIPYQRGILEYGSSKPLIGRYGDQVGVFKHKAAVTDYVEKWIENLSEPNLCDFGKKYLKELGPELIAELGYSYDETMAKLDKKELIIEEPLNNRNIPYQNDNGEITTIGGNHELAIIEKCKAEIRKNPKNDKAHNNIAILFCRMDCNEEALFHFREALKINPENIIYKKNLADFCYYRLGRNEEALEIYLNILATQPDEMETLNAIGKICSDLGRYDDAKHFFSEILKIDPDNAEAKYHYDKLIHLMNKEQPQVYSGYAK